MANKTKQGLNNDFMQLALEDAQKAFGQGEVPIGAVIVQQGQVLARAHNTRESTGSPLDHAELRVLQTAARLKSDWRLNDCDLYVTLEPCPMCLGALFQARVQRLIVGCLDPKRFPENTPTDQTHFLPSLKNFLTDNSHSFQLSSNNHKLDVLLGVEEAACSKLLRDFFRQRREAK